MIFSTHARLTRTSSDLRILSAMLIPPSPILTPNNLLISSTSGEIPILLEVAVHACDSPLPAACGEVPRPCDVSEEPKLTDKHNVATGNTDDPAHHSEMSPENWIRVESSAMCVAVGLSNGRRIEPPTYSSPDTGSGRLKDTHPTPYDSLNDDDDQYPSMLSDFSPMSKRRGKFRGLRDPHAQAPRPTTMELSAATAVPKLDLDGDHLLMLATFHTYTTLPTSTHAAPSPSPSVDVISPTSSPISQQRHRRPLERARAVRFPGRPRSPRSQVNEMEVNVTHSASRLHNRQTPYSRWQLTDSPPMVSTPSCTADIQVSDVAYPAVKHVVLPEDLSWLRHMTIELWIDQEGFRAVRPCMQLIGYSPRTRSLHPYEPVENAGTDITAGVAEFMPTKREAFVFHYAALDSAPTLRMISVASDESRDYISRQATLSVKANGVYTVLGTETMITSVLNSGAHGPRLQNIRLRWKFDYLVTDRKADGTGKMLPGEKTLTPLTFSCSPYLFHPFQGKKAGLIHIMKKNLIPKLGSQKLEPPSCVLSPNILPQASRHYLPALGNTATHIRSHSDATVKSGHCSPTRSPLDPELGGGIPGMNHIPRGRRRRASSAGENSLIYTRNEPGYGGIATSKLKGAPMTGHPVPTTRR